MSSLRWSAGSPSRILRAASTSLCGNTLIAARLKRQPSMMLAWLSSSETTTSSFVRTAATVPAVRGKAALEDDDRLGLLELGEPPSRAPRGAHRAGDRPDGAGPDAEPARRVERALAQPGVGREPEVIVGRQVDHLAVIEPRPGLLLTFEHSERAPKALRLQLGDLGAEISERIVAERQVPTVYRLPTAHKKRSRLRPG